MKPSVLPAEMRLVGEVEGSEDLHIFGIVEGEIRLDAHVVVEVGGRVHGNIRGRSVTVRGSVTGDVQATASIRVDVDGRMVGDVQAPRVNVVQGARFRGQVTMAAPDDGLPAPAATRASERPRRPRRRSQARTVEVPTVPGSLRAAEKGDTVPGSIPAPLQSSGAAPPLEPLPASSARLPPRMPAIRRTRARRRG